MHPDPLSFRGKTVVITGATGLVGRAIARALAYRGATLLLHGRRGGRLDSFLGEIREINPAISPRGLAADFDEPSGSRRFAEVVESIGAVHVLINGAALRPTHTLEATSQEAWERIFSVNVAAALTITRAAVRGMGNGGSIINLSSVAAVNPPGDYRGMHYILTKSMLSAFTRGLAKELGGRNIRVNALLPGPIVSSDRDSTECRDPSLWRDSFLRRPGMPEEIANVCLFLASPLSSYLTGETIILGGYVY